MIPSTFDGCLRHQRGVRQIRTGSAQRPVARPLAELGRGEGPKFISAWSPSRKLRTSGDRPTFVLRQSAYTVQLRAKPRVPQTARGPLIPGVLAVRQDEVLDRD